MDKYTAHILVLQRLKKIFCELFNYLAETLLTKRLIEANRVEAEELLVRLDCWIQGADKAFQHGFNHADNLSLLLESGMDIFNDSTKWKD